MSKITSYQAPVLGICVFVAFSSCSSVDELNWVGEGKEIDFSTARKFVAIQTAFRFHILGQILSG